MGPRGPSAAVTIEVPSFIALCNCLIAVAPVLTAEPLITFAPHDFAIFAGTSPSTEGDTMNPPLKPFFNQSETTCKETRVC